MSIASPADVRGVIDTSLDDADIQAFLDDAIFEIDQAVDELLTDTEYQQLEKYLAALRVVQTKDREDSRFSGGDITHDYDGSVVEELRIAVDKRDPSGTLATGRLATYTLTSTGDS